MPPRASLSLAALALASLASACGSEPAPSSEEARGSRVAAASASPTATAALPSASAPTSAAAATSAGAPLPTASATASGEPLPPVSEPAPTALASASATPPIASATASTAPSAPSAVPTTLTAPSASAAASAAPAIDLSSPASIAAALDAVYQPKPRFSARFIQKHKQQVAGVEKERRGTLVVERPNKLSFRYDAPSASRVVSDGATLKIYVAEDRQFFVRPLDSTEYPGAFGFLMGEPIAAGFAWTRNEQAKFTLGPVLVGTPVKAEPGYEQVLFYLDSWKLEQRAAGAVAGVLVLDAQGNRNRFELSDARFPDAIDPKEFTFEPPEGTTIVR